MSLKKIARPTVVGLALAGAALVATAAPALAADRHEAPGGHRQEAPAGDLAPAGELAPAGVPVYGLVQSAVGATKVVPGQSGPGH